MEVDLQLDQLSASELEALGRQILVRAAGHVPGPSDHQLAELAKRMEAGHDGTPAEMKAISQHLDEIETPGMGAAFEYDAKRALRWLAVHRDFSEVAPGVGRLLLRSFPYAIYFAVTPSGPAPRAILKDERSPLWWYDLPSRQDCPPEYVP